MKKVMLLALLLATLNSACKKSTTTTVAPTPLYIPWDFEGLMPGKSTYVGPPYSNVSGILITCKTTGSLTDSTGTANEYKRSWKYASSLDSLNSVKANGVDLHTYLPDFFASYRLYNMAYSDDGSLWNESSTNTWTVSPAAGASFTAAIGGVLPSFTGTLPDTLSTTSDFDYTFDATNTSNADSARFLIYYPGYVSQSTVVNAHGGTAHFAASQYIHLSMPIAFSDLMTKIEGKTYSGTLMAVVLYSHSFGYYGGRKYAFVKQRVVLHIVKLT